MAISVNEIMNVENCGCIISKSLEGDEYKWGLRFYILLLDCFSNWNLCC